MTPRHNWHSKQANSVACCGKCALYKRADANSAIRILALYSLPLAILACWLGLAWPVQAQGLRLPANATPRSPLLAAPAAVTSVTRQADYIVAIVNSEPITNNEVRQRADRVSRQIANANGERPEHALLLKEILERLVLERIQLQLARENNIKVDDYSVTQAEQSVAQQNQLSVPEMHRRMQAEGISPESLREELRNQLLILRLRERDVQARVRVSDMDIDQYLQDQQKQTSTDQLILNLAHIFIHVPENATPTQLAERNARAQQVLKQLEAGADFGELARNYSDGPESTVGGLLGQRPAQNYPELFVQATNSTPVGSVVGPLRSGAGLHLLKVVEKINHGIPSTAIQHHVRHILLRTGPALSEQQAALQLQELRDRIQRGQATFETLARTYSQDGSAKEGGDLGWAGPGRYVPEFEQALAALAPGQISNPVVSRFGVHLIQLAGRREAKLSPREQRDMMRDVVREKKLDEAYTTWIEELRARAWVEYREPPQ